MLIYFMRHGEAGYDAPSDFERDLTPRGRAQVLKQAEIHRAEIREVDRVFSSPITRARQTCNLVMEVTGKPLHEVEEVPWLRHECSADAAIRSLRNALGDDFEGSVALFSHQPLASQFLSLLCNLPAVEVPMGTASLARVDCGHVVAGLGVLEFLRHAET